jgi:hypothetical protein
MIPKFLVEVCSRATKSCHFMLFDDNLVFMQSPIFYAKERKCYTELNKFNDFVSSDQKIEKGLILFHDERK